MLFILVFHIDNYNIRISENNNIHISRSLIIIIEAIQG